MSQSIRRGFASTHRFRVTNAERFRDAMLFYAVTLWSSLDAGGVERFALSAEIDWPDVSDHPELDMEIGFPLVVAPHLPAGEVVIFNAVFEEDVPGACPRVGGYCMVVNQHGVCAGSRLDDAMTQYVLAASKGMKGGFQ